MTRAAPNASHTLGHLHTCMHTFKSHKNPTTAHKELFLTPTCQLFSLRAADGSSTAIPPRLPLAQAAPADSTSAPGRSKSCSSTLLLGLWHYPLHLVIARETLSARWSLELPTLLPCRNAQALWNHCLNGNASCVDRLALALLLPQPKSGEKAIYTKTYPTPSTFGTAGL